MKAIKADEISGTALFSTKRVGRNMCHGSAKAELVHGIRPEQHTLGFHQNGIACKGRLVANPDD